MYTSAHSPRNVKSAAVRLSREENLGDGAFKLLSILVIGAIACGGLGNVIFGLKLSNNVSAYFVYGAFFLQIAFLTLRVPGVLMWLYGLIFFQTFVLNFSQETFAASIIKLIGIMMISVTVFSFVSSFRNRILDVVRMYYGFSVVAACCAILQTTVFLVFGKALYPQDLLGGPEVTTGRLVPEVFGLLPRAASIASEPAHFALLLLPAVYLAALVLVGRATPLRLRSRWIAAIVILGLLLSFSLLGYLGLTLVVLLILFAGRGKRKVGAFALGLALILGLASLAFTQLPLFQTKLATFAIPLEATGDYRFTGNDLSGFALISNAFVAKSALSNSYLLGTGLNTHEKNYERYLPSYFSSSQVLMNLNATDAGSLFIRVASEFGLPGLLLIAWFLFKYKLKTGAQISAYRAINDMCFIYLVMYGARTGSYLATSLWLFAALYYYSFIVERRSSMQAVSKSAAHATEQESEREQKGQNGV